VWAFILGRAVMSLALGNSGLMMTTLAERTPENRQGLAFSIMNSAGPVGIFLGPLIGGPVVDRFGFRTLMAANVVLMVFVVLAMSFAYRDSYHGVSREPVLRMAADSLKVVFLSRRLQALFAALFFLYAGWMLALNYLPLTVTALYHGGSPATAIGLVLGGGGLVALVLGPAFGALADRYGRWKVLIIGAAVEAALWSLPYLTRQLIPFAILWSIISGIASGVFSVSFSVLSGSTTPQTRGRVMSFAYLPVNLGYFFGPLVGSVITRAGLFTVFPAAFIYTLCSLVVLFYARRQAAIADAAAYK
jgi:MFS family permease